MNKSNEKWNGNTKTADTRKTVLKSLFIEIETGRKSELKCFFFEHVKGFPTYLESFISEG